MLGVALLCYLTEMGRRLEFDKNQPRERATVSEYVYSVSPYSELGLTVIPRKEREPVAKLLQQLWKDERGQDIAEYAVMLAVILVIVVGTIRLIGGNANNVFSQVGSSIANP